MAKEFIDDKIEHIESDIEKLQLKSSMYISNLGSKGALHLGKEIINNAIDECINPNSPAKNISIYVDEIDNAMAVSDDGRGIPFEKIETVCTFIQAGSKFERAYGTSAGENGVGMTACNALSESFSVTSIRNGQKGIIKWKEGKIEKKLSIKNNADSNQHGTTVCFTPSRYYMGECDISVDELIDWLNNIEFLIPSEITINFSVQRKGKESNFQKKFKNKNGLGDYIERLNKDNITDIISLTKLIDFKEKYRGVDRDRILKLDVALTYSSEGDDEISDCFCNFTHNIDRGVHYNAVKQALSQYLINMTRESLSERDTKKIDIIPNDCSQGLILVINLSTNANIMFSGQVKEKLNNLELFKPIKQMTLDMLHEYFNNNPKELKRVCEIIKTNAKARIKSLEVRNSVLRGETSNLDEHRISDFIPCSNGRGQYKELFIIEGISASGSGRNGRDPKTQALFPLGGVPLNTFDDKTSVVLNNRSLKELVSVLRCNIGDKFDLTKLWYDKVIIMSDEDIDGYKITSLLSAFFLSHMPMLVKAGKLFKAISPLYAVKEKKNGYVKDKREYVKIFEAKINKAIEIIDLKTKKKLTSRDAEEFFLKNRNYLDELIRTSHHLAAHPQLVEFITYKRKDKDFKKALTTKFPEIKIEGTIINGIHEGRYQNLLIDHIFDKAVKQLEKCIFEVNDNTLFYLVKEFDGYLHKEIGILSVGDIISYCQKFLPEIVTRFKGLAELAASQLWDTTMNPNTRNLLRLSISDLEEDLSKFRIIHGDDSGERKQLMEFFRLDREDIDN